MSEKKQKSDKKQKRRYFLVSVQNPDGLAPKTGLRDFLKGAVEHYNRMAIENSGPETGPGASAFRGLTMKTFRIAKVSKKKAKKLGA